MFRQERNVIQIFCVACFDNKSVLPRQNIFEVYFYVSKIKEGKENDY